MGGSNFITTRRDSYSIYQYCSQLFHEHGLKWVSSSSHLLRKWCSVFMHLSARVAYFSKKVTSNYREVALPSAINNWTVYFWRPSRWASSVIYELVFPNSLVLSKIPLLRRWWGHHIGSSTYISAPSLSCHIGTTLALSPSCLWGFTLLEDRVVHILHCSLLLVWAQSDFVWVSLRSSD